jgi:ribosomal protein L22
LADDKDKKNPDVEPENEAAEDAPQAEEAEAKEPATAQPEAEEQTDEAKSENEAAEAPAEDEATDAEKAKKPSRRRRRGKAADADKAPARRKPAGPAEPILGEDGQPILVKAQSKYVRASARKARIVIDNIRGQSVPEARVTLAFTQRRVAKDVAKVLESAVANAEHNHELDGDDLHVAVAFADEGPTFKRWQPRARGRATPIMKRTSHITVVVSPTPAKDLEKYRKAAA